MPVNKFAVGSNLFNPLCTNDVPTTGQQVRANCNTCVTPGPRDPGGNPCLFPSRYVELGTPDFFFIKVEGGVPSTTFRPGGISLDPAFDFANSEPAQVFPFTTWDWANVGYAFDWYVQRNVGVALVWAPTGFERVSTSIPVVGCGWSANRKIPSSSDGSGNNGYESQLTYNSGTNLWTLQIELLAGTGIAFSTKRLPDVTFDDDKVEFWKRIELHSFDYAYRFTDGRPEITGTQTVSLHPFYGTVADLFAFLNLD